MPPSSALLPRLRRADPERFFTTLFAPPEHREHLALLYLFNHELARAREIASSPIMALIRLTWWREIVEGDPKPHELATPLTQALNRNLFAREDLSALITAREQEAEPDFPDAATFHAHARATAGRLARTAGKFLGADSPRIEDLGTAYGITGLLRLNAATLLPKDNTPPAALRAHALALLKGDPPPRAALPAALPAAYVRGGRLAVVRSAITGRF